MSKSKTIPVMTAKQISHFWSLVNKSTIDKCWPWIGVVNFAGYGRISLYRRDFLAHRVAYFIGHGIDPYPLLVCHKCDNKSCCNPDHYFLGTYSENIQDSLSKGRFSLKPRIGKPYEFKAVEILDTEESSIRCERKIMSKLSSDAVREIRKNHADGISKNKLAGMYGVSYANITRIINRETWKHLP